MKYTDYTGWANESITREQFNDAVARFIEDELRLDWQCELTGADSLRFTVRQRKIDKTVPCTPKGLYTLLIAILDKTTRADLTTIGANYYEGGYRIKSYRRNNVVLHLDIDKDGEAPYVIHVMNRRAVALLRFGREWSSHSVLLIVDAFINSFMASLNLQDNSQDD